MHHSPYMVDNFVMSSFSSALHCGPSKYFTNFSNILTLMYTSDIVRAIKNWVSFLIEKVDSPSLDLLSIILEASQSNWINNLCIKSIKILGSWINSSPDGKIKGSFECLIFCKFVNEFVDPSNNLTSSFDCKSKL